MASKFSWGNVSLWFGAISCVVGGLAVYALSTGRDGAIDAAWTQAFASISALDAAWTQAFASILALAVAVLVPLSRDSKRAAEELEKERKRAAEELEKERKVARASALRWREECTEIELSLDRARSFFAQVQSCLDGQTRIIHSMEWIAGLKTDNARLRTLASEVASSPLSHVALGDAVVEIFLLNKLAEELFVASQRQQPENCRTIVEAASMQLTRASNALAGANKELEHVWLGKSFDEFMRERGIPVGSKVA